MTDRSLDPADLQHILEHTAPLWEELRGQRIFITGGTGFFGCWLLESFLWANEKLDLGAQAVVLTRSPDVFQHKSPRLANHPAVSLYSGDVRDFKYPSGSFSHIIHAATDTHSNLENDAPLTLFDTIVGGACHTLEFARQCGAMKFLFTSSGAVYAKPLTEISHIPETYPGAPDPTDSHSVYGEGKRAAETLCAIYARRYHIETKIARCFAFVGPHLPLNLHFAIGNFIRDGMNGGPIRVNGDGTPRRSYLYAADMTIWLWTILIKGLSCRPYNVGSEQEISIRDLAGVVAQVLSKETPIPVQVAVAPLENGRIDRYVPSTSRAQSELQLSEQISLEDAIRRTVAWYIFHP